MLGGREPLNDMNNPGTSRQTPLHVNTLNIPLSGETANTTDAADIEHLMRQVAAEMHVDAQRAIDDLKRDKDLWNRVERLKADAAATRQRDANEGDSAVTVDAGMSHHCFVCIFELDTLKPFLTSQLMFKSDCMLLPPKNG